MTRTVVLLALLYVIWRVASWFGHRRHLEYVKRQEAMGALQLVRCERCGSYVSPAEVREEGRWPARRLVCAAGCGGVEGRGAAPGAALQGQ